MSYWITFAAQYLLSKKVTFPGTRYSNLISLKGHDQPATIYIYISLLCSQNCAKLTYWNLWTFLKPHCKLRLENYFNFRHNKVFIVFQWWILLRLDSKMIKLLNDLGSILFEQWLKWLAILKREGLKEDHIASFTCINIKMFHRE